MDSGQVEYAGAVGQVGNDSLWVVMTVWLIIPKSRTTKSTGFFGVAAHDAFGGSSWRQSVAHKPLHERSFKNLSEPLVSHVVPLHMAYV